MNPILLLLVSLAAPDAVPGRVIAPDGKPAAGAWVYAVHQRQAPPGAGYRSQGWGVDELNLPCDAQGRFDLPRRMLPAFVAAGAPAWAPGGAAPGDKATELVIRLQVPRSVQGQVLAPDGTPAVGVCATLVGFGQRRGGAERFFSWLPKERRAVYTARTDGAGVYRLQNMPPGDLQVVVEDAKSPTEYLNFAGQPPRVRLRPGCHIRGKVLDGGAGAAGWHVLSSVTGADGSFVLERLRAGEYPLSAVPPEGVERVAVPIKVRVDAEHPDAEVTFSAVRGGVVAGRVLNAETGAPAANVTVGVLGPDKPWPDRSWPTALSGSDGTFRLGLPAGKHLLRVERRSYPPNLPADATVTVRDGEDTPVELRHRRGPTLAGRVTDGAGKPAGGVLVTAMDRDGFSCKQATTAADGTFRMDEVPDDPLTLTATRGTEGLVIPLALKPPFPATVDVTIGALPQITLVGRVVDERGRPVSNTPIEFVEPQAMRGFLGRPSTVSDAEGRYRVVDHNLAADYRASAYVMGGSCLVLKEGRLVGDSGPERRLTDLVILSSSASVSGRVLNPDGKPAGGAEVFWPLGTREHRVVADAQGRFRIDALPDHPVNLMAVGVDGRVGWLRATPGKDARLVLSR